MGYFLGLSKSSTSTALDISELAIFFSGIVLVVGIFGEYKKLPKKLLLWPMIAFEILVMAGVAGELIADGAVYLFSSHLQTISDGEIAVLNKEAGVAREQAGKLELAAATLTKQAEDERLARLNLESLLGPRTLTPGQRRNIVEGLSKFSGVAVDLFVFGENEYTRFESIQFARVLDSAMGKSGAGIDTREYWGECEPSQPIFGTAVPDFIDMPVKDQSTAAEIKRVLKESGVDVSDWVHEIPICNLYSGINQQQKPRPGWAKIKIVVGIKPDPMLNRPTLYDDAKRSFKP